MASSLDPRPEGMVYAMHSRMNLTGKVTVRPQRWRLPRRIALVASALSAAICPGECKPPLSLQASVQKHPDGAAYARLGKWYGERSHFDCANQAFLAGMKLDPGSAQLRYFLGLSLYTSGKVEASVTLLQESIALDGAATQPRLLLARAFRQLDRTTKAEQQWEAVLKMDPASTSALDGLSNALIDGAEPQAAIDLLLAAKGRIVLNTELTLDLARAYGVAQMLDDAAVTVKQALDVDPNSPRLTSALATVYVRQKRFQDAEALMKAYLGRHPLELEAQVLYLRILVLNENHEKAIPAGRKLLVSAPHQFDVLYLNGILERETGDYENACAHLREAVKINPEDYSARYNYGAALQQIHDSTGARQQLEKAIALDGSQAEARFQLSLALRALGETAAAQEQRKVYQELSRADTARARAATNAKLAADKLAAGDALEAVRLYREAVADAPQDTAISYQLAVALRQSGDSSGERAALEQTVRIDPTFALAQNQLGYLIFHGGAVAEAEEHFRDAVKSAPAFTDAWINLAATLASEGRLPEAREAVTRALTLDPNSAQARQLSQDLNAAAQR